MHKTMSDDTMRDDEHETTGETNGTDKEPRRTDPSCRNDEGENPQAPPISSSKPRAGRQGGGRDSDQPRRKGAPDRPPAHREGGREKEQNREKRGEGPEHAPLIPDSGQGGSRDDLPQDCGLSVPSGPILALPGLEVAGGHSAGSFTSEADDLPYASLKARVAYWADPRHFMPVTASVAFYEFMRERYPEAYEDPGLWNLLGYLARGWYLHRDRRRLQLPFPLLAGLAGDVTRRVITRETYPPGEVMLHAMQRILGTDEAGEHRFTWSAPCSGGQPRLVKRLSWPDEVQRAIGAERRRTPWDGEPRVYWTERKGTGEPRRFDPARHRAKTSAELDELASQLRPEHHAVTEALGVLDLLHGTAPNALARLVRENFDDALDEAERIRQRLLDRAKQASGQDRPKLRRKAERVYEQQVRCLEGVKEAAKPRYFIATNSPRLFPITDHLTGLKASVRRALLRGLVEVDLASCHLAALAVILDLPLVAAFLETDRSVWTYLFEEMGLTEATGSDPALRKAIKDVVKQEGLYPALYGRERAYIVYRVNRALDDALAGTPYAGQYRGVGERFVEHPMIAEILAVRDEALARVEQDGGIRDVDGRFIALPGHEGDVVLDERATARSALCYAAGVIEMKLMSAVTELQAQQGGRRFEVLLWQHDGVSLRIVDKTRTRNVLDEIVGAVERRARELKVRTRLEVEESTLPRCTDRQAVPPSRTSGRDARTGGPPARRDPGSRGSTTTSDDATQPRR